jgi:hypothetical protein
LFKSILTGLFGLDLEERRWLKMTFAQQGHTKTGGCSLPSICSALTVLERRSSPIAPRESEMVSHATPVGSQTHFELARLSFNRICHKKVAWVNPYDMEMEAMSAALEIKIAASQAAYWMLNRQAQEARDAARMAALEISIAQQTLVSSCVIQWSDLDAVVRVGSDSVSEFSRVQHTC